MRRGAKLIQPAPLTLTLFGSFARRTAQRSSDVDVAASHDDEAPPGWEHRLEKWHARAGRVTGNPVNVIDLSASELDDTVTGAWLRPALREGIVLAGRPLSRLTEVLRSWGEFAHSSGDLGITRRSWRRRSSSSRRRSRPGPQAAVGGGHARGIRHDRGCRRSRRRPPSGGGSRERCRPEGRRARALSVRRGLSVKSQAEYEPREVPSMKLETPSARRPGGRGRRRGSGRAPR